MKEDKSIQLSAVEDHDGILTIRGGGARRDWNGIHYKQGMRQITISKVFAQRFILIAAAVHFAFVLVATQQNSPLLLGRPQAHATGYVLAAMAAAVAALNLFIAGLIVRRISRSYWI